MKCRSVLVGRMLVGNKRYVPHCCAISRAFKRAREWRQKRNTATRCGMFRVGSCRAFGAFVRVQCRGQLFARNTKYPRGVCECGKSHTAAALVLFVSLIPPPLFLAEFYVCYSVLTTSRHINCISYLRPPLKKKVLNLASSASKFGMFA